MTALKISRALLLLAILVWAASLLAAYLQIGFLQPILGIGIWAAVAIGPCAAACVIFQFVVPRNQLGSGDKA